MRTRSHVVSDVGRVRENNEDNFLVVEERALYVVADGMGGHANGEVASRICVEAIGEAYADKQVRSDVRERYRNAKRGAAALGPYAEFELASAVRHANGSIYRTAVENPNLRDMGTTVVALRFVGSRVYVGSVGDSRIYRWREGKLEQITEDHSLANEYVKLRLLKKEDVPRFPYKNVIVRALGLANDVEVDTHWHRVREGDRFLLCSDGLTDLVSDDEIAEELGAAESPETSSRRLVELALAHGGIDNVTVLVVWAEADESPSARKGD